MIKKLYRCLYFPISSQTFVGSNPSEVPMVGKGREGVPGVYRHDRSLSFGASYDTPIPKYYTPLAHLKVHIVSLAPFRGGCISILSRLLHDSQIPASPYLDNFYLFFSVYGHYLSVDLGYDRLQMK